MEARLIESFEIAPEVKHFRFEVPSVEQVGFVPGQFVSISRMFGEKKITRAYSIASEPAGNRFDLCLNRVQDGLMSPRLFELQPGEAIEMRPPLGHFVLKAPAREAVLVATGTGIAPFRSMLRAEAGSREFTLLFGVRYAETILYREELEALAAAHGNVRFWPTLSRGGDGWSGRRGHVQAHLTDAIGDRRDLDVYICGMKAMVDDVRNILKEMGFDRKQIVYEKYD